MRQSHRLRDGRIHVFVPQKQEVTQINSAWYFLLVPALLIELNYFSEMSFSSEESRRQRDLLLRVSRK